MITMDNGYGMLTYADAHLTGAVFAQESPARPVEDWQAVLEGFLSVSLRSNPPEDLTGTYALTFPGDGIILTKFSDHTVADQSLALTAPEGSYGLLSVHPNPDDEELIVVLIVTAKGVQGSPTSVMICCRVGMDGTLHPRSSLNMRHFAAMRFHAVKMQKMLPAGL